MSHVCFIQGINHDTGWTELIESSAAYNPQRCNLRARSSYRLPAELDNGLLSLLAGLPIYSSQNASMAKQPER